MDVNVHEAKTHLSRLLARVEAGETIVISRAGEPVALLSPYGKPGPRKPGRDRIVIRPNFDDPLPELEPGYEHPADPLRPRAR
jgi:prevent-host-death family protein